MPFTRSDSFLFTLNKSHLHLIISILQHSHTKIALVIKINTKVAWACYPSTTRSFPLSHPPFYTPSNSYKGHNFLFETDHLKDNTFILHGTLLLNHINARSPSERHTKWKERLTARSQIRTGADSCATSIAIRNLLHVLYHEARYMCEAEKKNIYKRVSVISRPDEVDGWLGSVEGEREG